MKKKIVLASIIAALTFSACHRTNEVTVECMDSASLVDSLEVTLHQIDSLLNSGQMAHLDIYQIGKLKTITISVQKITVGDDSISFINFSKDCGNDYYYSWKDSRLLVDECKYLSDAINTILEQKKREVDHEERYAYITKDNMRIFSANTNNGKGWKVDFSIDYRSSNSSVSMSDDDLTLLQNYLDQGLKKIEQL